MSAACLGDNCTETTKCRISVDNAISGVTVVENRLCKTGGWDCFEPIHVVRREPMEWAGRARPPGAVASVFELATNF